MSTILRCFANLRFAVGIVSVHLYSFACADLIQLEAHTQLPIMAEPGDLVTLTIGIQHSGLAEQLYGEAIELPAGWRTLLPLEHLLLAPGAQFQHSLLVQIPKYTEVNSYTLRYSLNSNQKSYSQTITVTVLPQQRIVMKPSNQIDNHVLAGETQHWRVRVFNLGNAPADLNVKQRLSVRGAVQVVPQQLSLAAQSQQDLDVWITPDAGFNKPTWAVMRLSLEDANGSVVQHLRQRFAVIPRISGADPLLRYPLLLRSTVRKQSQLEQQLLLSGAGYVDEKKKHYVSFSTQLKLQQAHSFAAQLDRFWLRYQTERVTLRGGDQVFRLSPLTLPARTGRGAAIDLKLGPTSRWGVGFFLVTTTSLEVQSDITAGHVQWLPHPLWQFRLHGLRQLDTPLKATAAQAASHSLWSMQASYTKSYRRFWQAEVARSLRVISDTSTIGFAGRFNATTGANTKSGFSRLRLRLNYAQPAFEGPRNNLADGSISANWPVSVSINSRWSYRYFDRNVARDLTLGLVVTEQLWTTDWFLTLTPQWQFSLGHHWHLLQRDAGHQSALTHLRQMGLSYQSERWHWQGRIHQSVTAANQDVPKRFGGSLSAQYRVGTQLSVRAHMRGLQRRHEGPAELLSSRREFSLQSRWQPAAQWLFNASYRRGDLYDQRWSEQRLSQSWVFVSQYQWRDQHQLSLQWRQQLNAQAQHETALEMSYKLRLAPALRRRQSVGSLYGQVLLKNGSELMPVAKALVRIDDQAALTDPEGYYEINSLAPQSYPVRVEWPRQLGAASVPPSQAVVIVKPGQRVDFPIVIEPLGSLSGQLHIEAVDSGQALPPLLWIPIQLAAIQVTVFNGQEHYVVQANEQGYFELTGLSPGDWQVQINTNTLPKRTVIKPSAQVIRIESGQNSSAEFLLSSAQPSFKWIGQGEAIFVID